MPVTLAQAALNTQDDLDANIIDEYRKQSAILDTLVFHDAVSAMGGGSTLTYGYHRLVTERSAAFREINSEYTPEVATKARYTVDLKPLGGSFEIDRVLAQIARGAEVSFQLKQLIKATTTKFTDELINGDTAVDAVGFDGLDKALTGSDTEMFADARGDWDTLSVDASQSALDLLDEFFGKLDGAPTIAVANEVLCAKIRAIYRRANQYVESPVAGLTDEFGQPVMRQRIGNVLLVDAGAKAGSNTPIIPLRDPDSAVWTITESAGTDGGTYKLQVEVDGDAAVTGDIAYDASAATIDTAITALSNVGASDVSVSGSAGGPYTVTFEGALATKSVVLSVAEQSATDGGVPEWVTVAEVAMAGAYTDLYTYRVGMDGFHGVAVADQPLLQTWLPDFTKAGAVKTGEAEMGPVATVLKATKAAAVLRNIKVR